MYASHSSRDVVTRATEKTGPRQRTTSMYRHALLRLPCEDCGVTHAPSALLLAPAGGWVCRRCQLGREVVVHDRAAAVRARGISPLALVVRLLLMVMATGAVIDILR